MFYGAEIKLRDAQTSLMRLMSLVVPVYESNLQIISGPSGRRGSIVGTSDPVAFSEAYSSTKTQVRSIGDAILRDSEALLISGFKTWADSVIKLCKNDELMKFINDKRNDDLHEGKSTLVYTMHVFEFNTTRSDRILDGLRLDGTGPHWIVGYGTRDERRIPFSSHFKAAFSVAVANPPQQHLSKKINSDDPISICQQGMDFYIDRLNEARRQFGS